MVRVNGTVFSLKCLRHCETVNCKLHACCLRIVSEYISLFIRKNNMLYLWGASFFSFSKTLDLNVCTYPTKVSNPPRYDIIQEYLKVCVTILKLFLHVVYNYMCVYKKHFKITRNIYIKGTLLI